MKTQVAVIGSIQGRDLQDKINRALEEIEGKGGQVVDIKFSLSVTGNGATPDDYEYAPTEKTLAAMIIYRVE